MSGEKKLLLKIVTPRGVQEELACTSVRLRMPDGAEGHGGGWLGIHPGHVGMLLAVAAGEIQGDTEQGTVKLQTAGGFASVEGDTVTVLTGNTISE